MLERGGGGAPARQEKGGEGPNTDRRDHELGLCLLLAALESSGGT